ncbi:hypothetical protein [Kitasatospora sp. NPDC008115]|uniref:hypothetical protein n=1 Tax=Kitasatospora sp. NPDC008115 TaxID=3364022 RepID=UPI0036EA39B3
MRKRRTPWALGYFLTGGVCLLLSMVMAAGARHGFQVVPVLLLGVPGAVLMLRAPRFGVSYGPTTLKYSGLLGTRSHAWADVREVRVAVLKGSVYSSDVPELVLADGRTDPLLVLQGHSWGLARNRRVARLVAELEAARAAAP